MKKNIVLPFLLLFSSVFSQIKVTVDAVFHHAKINTLNEKGDVAEAMAVLNGKILAIGTNLEIQAKYTSPKMYDLQGKNIFPGFIDAHAHFFGLGTFLQNANLKETKSWDDVISTLSAFSKTHKEGWLLGNGWDQNNWPNKNFPTKKLLDEIFPNRPVFITRVDGHAAMANQKALELASIDENTKIEGGEIVLEEGKPTGLLIDNAKDRVEAVLPAPGKKQIEVMLDEAQKICFSNGLTSITDAGLDYEIVEEIQKLQKANKLKMRMNVMLSDAQKNIDWLSTKGIIKNPRMHVQGFKFYGDGALGSRGASLLKEYSDKPHHRGFMLSDEAHFRKMAKLMFEKGFQMNTHAIGDSANRVILKIYAEVLKEKNDRRWRIEHAQVVDRKDIEMFGKYSIIPSVQPTHATSDMFWAMERLGDERIKTAYAYRNLLNQNTWMPLGTDFPIEGVNPIETYYAAVVRKNLKGLPEEGFQIENALSRMEALRGMTIWAAKAAFEESEKGSLELGKYADFVILDQDLLTVEEDKILKTHILQTWLGGELVFDHPMNTVK